MKRLAIFGGRAFYARGGFHDLIGDAHCVEDATAEAERLTAIDQGADSIDWWQVVDLRTGAIVADNGVRALGALDRDAAPHHLRERHGHLVQTNPAGSDVL